MLLADPPPPVIDFIPTPRATAELMVELIPAFGCVPPMLVIAGGWVTVPEGGESFAHWDRYEVRRAATSLPGRLYRLGRDAKKLLTLEPGGDRRPEYEVFVGPVPSLDRCDCRGFTLNNPERLPCKHMSAVRHFADALDNPEWRTR